MKLSKLRPGFAWEGQGTYSVDLSFDENGTYSGLLQSLFCQAFHSYMKNNFGFQVAGSFTLPLAANIELFLHP
jgi:hypothetical protein